ncbi:hypothetical protein [Rubrivirga sp. IMCC45206]|uniref:hypothetical protein n=1 Tax=Rubrivirga sp. IMCC45206 TaxID=3391614 RepID=UPI00398FD13F
MLDAFVRALPRSLASAYIALVLVNVLNLALGETWAEVQAGLLGDVGFFTLFGVLFAAYDAWRSQRKAGAE